MNTLQFIDSMTGRLAWPLAAVILSLVFRRSLTQLLERVRKLRYREAEAELAEATHSVEEAVEQAAKPLPEDAGEGERENRLRISRLLTDAAWWGFAISKTVDTPTLPAIRIVWDNDQPTVELSRTAARWARPYFTNAA